MLGWVLGSGRVGLWCTGLDQNFGLAMKKNEVIALCVSLFSRQDVMVSTETATGS